MDCEWVKSAYPLTDKIRIGIDQITISIPFEPPKLPDEEMTQDQITKLIKAQDHYKKEALGLINWARKATRTLFKSSQPKKIKGGSAPDRINVFCEADGSYVATMLVGLCYGTPVLNYTFNPSKLTSEGRVELATLLTMTHPMGYEGIYVGGVITRFEYFIDIEDVHPCDLALLDTGKRKTTPYEITTTYNGRRGSNLVGAIYDKAAEQKIDRLLTRIEARIKRRDVTFQGLVEAGINNPFAPFIVVPASALDVVAKEWPYDPELAHRIRQHGLYGGIKSGSARKVITKRLRELSVPWWNADSIWAKFGVIMDGFRPAFTGGSYDFSLQDY